MKSSSLWKQINQEWYKRRITYFLILLVIVMTGCGKKGPPIPPPEEIPPLVVDLVAERNGQIVTLSWSIPEEKDADPLVGYKIYHSKIFLKETDCRDCPVPFQLLDDILIQESNTMGSENRKMFFSQTLEPDDIQTMDTESSEPDDIQTMNTEAPEVVDKPEKDRKIPKTITVYQYKVVGYTEYGVRSPDSNVVRLDYPASIGTQIDGSREE